MAATVLNTNTPVQQTTTSFSSTFTVNTGSNLIAFALVVFDGANGLSISSITLGGDTMTSCGAAIQNTTSNGYAQAYYKIAPQTGTPTLAITVSGATDIYANVVVVKGAVQSSPVSSYQSSQGAADVSGNFTLTAVTSDTDSVCLSCTDGGTTNNVTTNQTSLGTSTNGVHSYGSARGTTPASSITFTWSGTAGTQVCALAFSVAPAPNVVYKRVGGRNESRLKIAQFGNIGSMR